MKLAEPMGYVPDLGFGRPDTYGQKEQSNGTAAGLVNKVRNAASKLGESL